MIEYKCDGCAKRMGKGELRYTVKIDVRAAYDEIEVGLADLVRDHRKEMIDLIEELRGQDPDAVEAQVYKGFTLDLCPRCQAIYLKDPLHFRADAQPEESPTDIDGFLRSLGYGE